MTLNEIIMQSVLLEEHPAMPKGFQPTFQKVIEAISEMPEIIRCKDCKWCSEHYDTDGNVPYWDCINWDGGTDADGFCHEAELRGDSGDL